MELQENNLTAGRNYSPHMNRLAIPSLEQIALKYKDDYELVKCTRLFFQNQNEFSSKCCQMSRPHLRTYICILLENCDSKSENSKDVLFDVEYILKSLLTKTELIGENGVFNEVLDVLSLTISITGSSSKDILEAYTKTLTFVDDEKIGCGQLSVAEIVYDFYPELIVHSSQTSIVKCLFSETQTIQNRSLKLVRRMLEGDCRSGLLDEILCEIEKNETSKRIQCLAALCYLIECTGFSNAYANRPSLRTYLQKELLSTDRSAYKYALYILRKLIEIHSIGIEHTLLSGSEIRAPWETFFLIQETLDEKQSHLILPVLEQLPKTEILPMNWYYVLMTQLLRHENTVVLQCGLKYAISNIVCDAESIKSDPLMGEFFTSLMLGLNNTSIYAKSDFPVEKLKNFFAPVVDIAFDKFLTINWKSVPMYHMINALADLIFDHQRHNSELVAEQFIKILRLVHQVPNVHIRKGIQSNIRRTIRPISGHLSVETFAQLVQLACIDTMKDMEFLKFDHWTHEDVVTVLGHDTLGDEMKKTFLSWLEITDDDVLALLKLMKMNGYPYFHNFEVWAALHFYTINIWLCNALKGDGLELETVLSMYYLLFVINDGQHNKDIASEIAKKYAFASTLKRNVLKHQHLVDCLCQLYSTNVGLDPMVNAFIACGTETTTVVAIKMLEKVGSNLIDEKKLSEIIGCVKELQNPSIITRFLKILKCEKALPMRLNVYSELIQMTFNNNHLLGIVVDHFLQEDEQFLKNSSKHIQNLLCYGITLKGDQRVDYDLCQLIYSNDTDWVMASHIRFKFLHKLRTGFTSSGCSTFLSDLRNYLFKLSADLNLSKPRYYADSQQHRSKLRIMQALAVLLSKSNTWDGRLQAALLNENNQPNVTFILELMIGRTVDSVHLKKLLQEAKSNSARQSIFVIMYYVCSRTSNNALALTYIESILPFTMGQHFNTRLFAQITVVKIIEKFKMNVPSNQYNSVYEQIMNSFGQGNTKQISEKFLQDFRFNCIDCTDLLNPIYFLCEIPRVTQMAKDELIPLRLVQKDANDDKFTFKEPFHVNINMCGAHNENIDGDGGSGNVQKKIIPMKNIVPDANLLETLPNRFDSGDRQANKEGMIVVASLISRSPNLGGLSRTCEIFGAEQLILDSLKHVENKEFQSLSMTSEKWLNIGEVKSWQLFDYLLSMKSKGYYIIGAEQTANGKILTELNFPKKTVLLLGNEKDGIPANLLSVLDVAVEIPQLGVVRSLNVHVSGALFVWEYARQHHFSS
ncbi:uncharacterized protein LOC119066209 isoform X2 [Bradysia coprophila]|uniref:uncharacterized protein LOC119066209 isoform X2 n=1 Tax=Bradysia coprophila TaxID=38358 RepID=UPI00187DCD3B|nr:uncharacterized protein LOC119066209 isoform X2 [Bradysia coprophila]